MTIYYNVIGPIVIPEDIPLPAPEVTVNTRKGVWVNCPAGQKNDVRYSLDTVTYITLVTRTGFEPMLKA